MSFTKVEGSNNKHKVQVYTISTCGWCRKMKRLLKKLDVEYEFIDIDLLEGEDEDKVRAEMKKHHSIIVTPLIVIDDGAKVIVGFLEDDIRRFFGNG
jgi:glutaredoxin-like protein NrdH